METSKGLHKLNKKKGEAITGIIMVAPAVILLLIFVFAPLVIAVYRSFFNITGAGVEFVGIEFYQKTLTNKMFLQSILNVFIFAIIITVLQIVLSFLFANVLVRLKGHFGVFARTIIYLPYLLSGIVVAVIFTLLTTFNGGILNSILGAMGIDPVAWNNDQFWAPVCIIAPSIWIGFGYTTLVLYAGLINVPKDYYEAAEMDGAGFLRTTFSISIPCMKNYFILLIVTNIVNNLQMYEIPMIMTNGQPLNKTLTPVLYIMHSRANGNISDSEITAMSIVVMIIILLINSCVFYLFKDKEGRKA